MDPGPAQAKPKVLVLCDDDLLQRVIALCLRDCVLEAPALLRRGGDGRNGRRAPESYDLIVLALGASRAVPLVALTRASLLGCVEVTPLLVISRRAFEADPAAGIYHMPFPFDAGELSREVGRLAGSGCET